MGLAPEITVIETAKAKLHACMAYPDPEAVIIAADTIVYADGHILGKPCDGADAARMLSLLSGKKHSVYSGLSIFFRGRELSDYELTDVYFRSLNADEIQAYVDSGEPLDKAGAYAAQGAASSFIRRIEGDFFNVVGLPVYRLHMMLTEIGAK